MLQQKYQRNVDLKVLPELTEREKQIGGGGAAWKVDMEQRMMGKKRG